MAAGVFSLSLAGMVFLTLIAVCCHCCCCRGSQRVDPSERRRTRMINQLRKEGYSVTRDYRVAPPSPHLPRVRAPIERADSRDGYTNQTLHVQERDVREGERAQLLGNAHDPPPSYSSVQRDIASQSRATVPSPIGRIIEVGENSQSASPGYTVNYHTAPHSTAVISRHGPVNPALVIDISPLVPQVLPQPDLIDLETEIPSAPTLSVFDSASHSANVDLLCDDSPAMDNVENLQPPVCAVSTAEFK